MAMDVIDYETFGDDMHECTRPRQVRGQVNDHIERSQPCP